MKFVFWKIIITAGIIAVTSLFAIVMTTAVFHLPYLVQWALMFLAWLNVGIAIFNVLMKYLTGEHF